MFRFFRHAVIALMALASASWSAADELPCTELEAPRFDGGILDNHVLPPLNTRFSAFNANGTLVAATCGSQVFLWKVPSGELLWRTTLPLLDKPQMVRDRIAWVATPGHQVSFSPKGNWLAVSGCYSSANIYFWNVATIISDSDDKNPIVLSSAEIVEATPRGWNAALVYPNLFWQSEDSAIIYTRGNLYSLRISDSLRLRPYLGIHPSHWAEVAIDPGSGDRLSMIGVELTLHQAGSLFTVFHNREVIPRVDAAGPARFTPLAYVTANRDWSHFAGVTRDLKSLGILDAGSGRTRMLEESSPMWSTHLAWSSNARILATGRSSDRQRVSRLRDRGAALAATSRDDMRAALFEANAPALVLWNTTTARKLASIPTGTLTAGNGSVCDVGVFSPDDRYLLTHVPQSARPGRPGYFQLWDVNSVLQKLQDPQ